MIICALFSCNNKHDESVMVIDTEAGKSAPANLSEVFDPIKMVKLETGDSIMIGRVDGVYVTKDFILIEQFGGSEKKFLKFDSNGHFIASIGKFGHGPGEYTFFSGVAIDTALQRIVLPTFTDFIVYNFKGDFVQSVSRNIVDLNNPDLINESLTCSDGHYWQTVYRPMMESDNGGFMERKLLYKLDDKLKILDSILVRQVFLKMKIFTGGFGGEYMSRLKSGMYYYCPVFSAEPVLRDTLYRIEESKLIPVIKLDFSDVLSVKEDTYANADFSDYVGKYMYEIRNITLRSIYRTDRYVFADYYYNRDNRLFCYDLKGTRRFNMSKGFTDNLFATDSTVHLMPVDLDKGEFCYVRNGYELEGKIEGINENSNPVIFFIKTKE